METRRSFIKKSMVAASLAALPVSASCINIATIASDVPLKSNQVKSAAVLWYSQSGNTQKCGQELARTLGEKGISMVAGDFREMDLKQAAEADLIIVGTPVFYYDAPEYALAFLDQLPDLDGKPVASFVTFGGPEGNQHNAACSILDALIQKNGVPVGLGTFMTAKTYPLSYDKYEEELKQPNAVFLPDASTNREIRAYADAVVMHTKERKTLVSKKKLTARELLTWIGPVFWTKRSIDNHQIIEKACVQCGTCVDKCPVDAIDLGAYAVDTDACVLCFGCLNNCQYQAMNMESGGQRLIGFYDFMKKHNLKS